MGRQTFIGPGGSDATAISTIGTEALLAIARHADVRHFWDAQCAEYVTKVNRLVSHRRVDGQDAVLYPASTLLAPYVIDTDDGARGIEVGTGTTGANAGSLIGDANATLPTVTGPWQVNIYGKQNAGSGGTLWATDGPSAQLALVVLSDGRVRFYGNYTSQTVNSVVAGTSDGAYHLWTVTHDGAGVVKLYKDGVQIDSDSAITFPTLDSHVLRFGSVHDTVAGNPADVQEGGWEFVVVAESASTDIIDLVMDLVAERHP